MSQLLQVVTQKTKGLKWSWSCRGIPNSEYFVEKNPTTKPVSGDIAMFKVKDLGYHKSVVTIDNKKLRLYENDLIIGTFGARYATDGFEARVGQLNRVSMLTAAGMIGTVRYRHKSMRRSTKLTFVGFLSDTDGKRINLKNLMFEKKQPSTTVRNLVVVVGSGMNSGKTTTAAKLIHSLSKQNINVASCKLTGSVSHRDQNELHAASSIDTIDFSDYGFPSTYLCNKKELVDLFDTITADMQKSNPDLIVMEIADGILQRETDMLLKDKKIKDSISGTILAAESAPSALYSSQYLEKQGYKTLAISGTITSSPLSLKEFQKNSKIPVASSADSGDDLAKYVIQHIQN